MKIALYAIKKGNNVKQVYDAIQAEMALEKAIFLEAPHGTLTPNNQVKLADTYQRLTSEYSAARKKAKKSAGVPNFPDWVTQKSSYDDATAKEYSSLLIEEATERLAAKNALVDAKNALVLEKHSGSHRTVDLNGTTLLTIDDLLPSDEDEVKIKAELAKSPVMVWAPGYRDAASVTQYNDLLKDTELGTKPREVPTYAIKKSKLLLTPCQTAATDLDTRLADSYAQDLGLWVKEGVEADSVLLLDYDSASGKYSREWWQLPSTKTGLKLVFFRGYDADGTLYSDVSRICPPASNSKPAANKSAAKRTPKAPQKLCPPQKRRSPPKKHQPPKTPPKVIPPKVIVPVADLPGCPSRYDSARTLNIPFNFGTAGAITGNVSQVGVNIIGGGSAYKPRPDDVKMAFGLAKEALQAVKRV